MRHHRLAYNRLLDYQIVTPIICLLFCSKSVVYFFGMDLTFADIKKLSELFKPEEDSSDSDDGLPRTGLSRFGPGHIGMTSAIPQKVEDEIGSGGGDGKGIWDDSEIPDGIKHDESEDPREKPEFEIKYKQEVTPEDMFLQMGPKTPGTASCEDMVIQIKLPHENYSDVDLHVEKNVLELRSPKYRLSLPLPHPVKPNLAKSVWDPDTNTLVVTLRMDRELDFANF